MTTKTIPTAPATKTGTASQAETTLPQVYKTRQMFEIEQAHGGRDIRLILIDLYNALGSQAAVAKKLDVTPQSIDNWFTALGIAVETHSSARLTVTAAPAAD